MAYFKFHEKEREIDPRLLDDIGRIIKKLYGMNDRLLLAFSLAYWTGARISEITSLHWKDIDLEKKTITYRRRAWNQPGTKGSKKGRAPKMRIVPLPYSVGLLLVRFFRKEKGWIFSSQKGKHIAKETMIRELAEWVRVNLNYKFTFHDLRHVYASVEVEKRNNPLLLAKMLGHVSLQSTMIYTHFKLEEDKNFYGQQEQKEHRREKAINQKETINKKWKPKKWKRTPRRKTSNA